MVRDHLHRYMTFLLGKIFYFYQFCLQAGRYIHAISRSFSVFVLLLFFVLGTGGFLGLFMSRATMVCTHSHTLLSASPLSLLQNPLSCLLHHHKLPKNTAGSGGCLQVNLSRVLPTDAHILARSLCAKLPRWRNNYGFRVNRNTKPQVACRNSYTCPQLL